MNMLRKELNKLLKTFHPNVIVNGKSKSRVYFHTAPDDAPYPYVVFDLPNSFTNEEQEIFNLDVDIWDNQSDTTELEALAGLLWKSLHNYIHLDQDMQFSLYRENRLVLDDDDPRIKRRKLIFQLKYFDRRLNDE